MYNKSKKRINNGSEQVYFSEKAERVCEKTLVEVIGQSNLQKWNKIKIQLGCKSNDEFVTKLLEIAQEFLSRELSVPNDLTKPADVLKKRVAFYKNKLKLPDVKFGNDKHNQSDVSNDDVVPQAIALKSKENNSSDVQIETKTTKIGAKSDAETGDIKSAHSEADVGKTPMKLTESPNEDSEEPDHVDKIKIKICHHCNAHHFEGNCPVEYPHYVISDAVDRNEWIKKYKPLHEKQCNSNDDEKDTETTSEVDFKYSYSLVSLPDCLAISKVQDDLRVIAKTNLEPFTQFGPLVGKIVKEKDIPEDVEMKYIWEAVESSGNIYFNTESTSVSNWTRYMRPAPRKEENNITVVTREEKLYFVTIKFIGIGDELLYWQYSASPTGKKKLEKKACGGCNIEFSHPLYYRTHCSLFHDVRYSLTIKKYHCKVCGVAVLGKENIMKHAAELHNGQGAYQCQFCKKFFLRLNYLEMHRTYGCSANPHRSVPLCDFCGKKFCQPQKLKVHIKRMHSNFAEVLKEFQCKDCLKILGSRAALQRHMKEVHQKQTDGQCSKCGKKFQNKSNLKIHMLTHSGIKPFRCTVTNCNAAFTTKQCLQFHYKKVHNFAEDNMPKIERSIDYTFQAYSGSMEMDKENEESQEGNENTQEKESESESERHTYTSQTSRSLEIKETPTCGQLTLTQPRIDTGSYSRRHLQKNWTNVGSKYCYKSVNNQNPDDPSIQTDETIEEQEENPVEHKEISTVRNIKVLTKGSKKWISDESPTTTKLPDIYSVERLSKDTFPSVSLPEPDIYDRNKLTNINDFNRHDASNASLLVEAALNSVCNEPELDIDVSTTPNCPDSLVNNLYSLAQPDNLPDVGYNEAACINDSRHITLISPPITDHVSVTDDLKDELNDNEKIDINYSGFSQGDFSPANSPDEHRVNFVRNYINSLSPPNPAYSEKNSTVPSPPRFDLGHGVSSDRLSCDDDVVSVQNLSVQNLSIHSKNVIHMDLPIYKAAYKSSSQDFRKISVNLMDQDHLTSGIQSTDVTKELDLHNHSKYSEDISSDVRHKFDVDLDIRLRNYESTDNDSIRQKSHLYDTSDLDFRTKAYDLIDGSDSRNKQYDIESDFRTDRNFEPLILNPSELQGLDMSARSFHNYSNFNRYHPLYPELDRVDLRLNYSPPPSTYTHADILRVSSLDLTSPGRHSVDLSLRNHPLHQIANTRLLTEHALPSNTHRLLDQNCLISADLSTTRHLTTERLISESSTRILTDHTTSRLLNDSLPTNHLLNPDQSRLISEDARLLSEQSRLLDQSRLISETRLLTSATRSGSTSPVQGFGGYSMTQNPYHPTSLAPRPHVTSPTPTAYHYSPYY